MIEKEKKWHEMSDSELESEFATNLVNGLTRKAAAAKSKKSGANIIFRFPHGSFTECLKEIISDPSSVILVLIAVIAAMFERNTESIVIVSLIALNCFSVLFTYVKAHRVLENMNNFSLPVAKVIREGRLYLITMTGLVPGDLIYLREGDIVPADVRIISSDNFYVSEKGLTGNNNAIRKSPMNYMGDGSSPEKMYNVAFASSVVLKGNARAIVVAVGNDTLVSVTGKNDLLVSHDKLDLFVTLRSYSTKLSLLMLLMVVAIMLLEMAFGLKSHGIYEIFLNGMSIAVAAMTEFFTAFGYIIVARGLFGARTGRSKTDNSVIIKNIKSIEKLRDINCLIVRKDGVLSELRKQVEAFWYGGQLFEVKNYEHAEDFAYLAKAAVVTTGVYTTAAVSGESDMLTPKLSGDNSALVECAERYGLYNIELEREFPIVMHISAGKNSPYDMTCVREGEKFIAYVKGDASAIVPLCEKCKVGAAELTLDGVVRSEINSAATRYSKTNAGVLAIAVCETDVGRLKNGIHAVIRRDSKLTLIGLVAVKAPMFEGAALTVDRLIRSGIKVVLNSAGGSQEDMAAAASLGICNDERDVLTEAVFSGMTPDQMRVALPEYSVYSGLSNASLRKAVTMLSECGYNVGYCAGGLSDLSVMECADIGYVRSSFAARGRNGKQVLKSVSSGDCADSDALRFKADVIIPSEERKNEGGILSISRSIMTSKLVYKNMMNLLGYFLTVEFARLFIVLYSVFTQDTVLTPIQILFGGLIIDFLSVLSIAFTKPGVSILEDYGQARRDLANRTRFFLRQALFGVFWAAMTILVPRVLSLMSYNISGEALSACSFISFTLLELVVLAEVKRKESIFLPSALRYNPFYAATAVLVLLFFAMSLYFPSLGKLFGILPLTRAMAVSILTVVLLVLSALEIYKAASSVKPQNDGVDKNK